MKFNFKQYGLKESCSLMKELPKRTTAIKSQFIYLAAKGVLEDVQSRIPSEYKDLKKSLRLQRVSSMENGSFSYVVSLGKVRSDFSKDDNVVLYVSGKKKGRPAPYVEVLERYNPWTVDTFPVLVDPKLFSVSSKKVKTSAVEKVRSWRTKDRQKWSKELISLGIKPVQSDKIVALSDVEGDSMRLEFGLGGESSPHWRPSIIKLLTRGKYLLARRKDFKKAISSEGYRGWERWPTRIKHKISLNNAKKYVKFQKKLGIKVKK